MIYGFSNFLKQLISIAFSLKGIVASQLLLLLLLSRFSRIRLLAQIQALAWIFQARALEWGAVAFSKPAS